MRAFSYTRAESTQAALRSFDASLDKLDHSASDIAYLAGGTTLLDLMKLDILQPSHLIDINGLSSTNGEIRLTEGDNLSLGSLVRMSDAARHPEIVKRYPVIAQSLLLAASPQLRNRATLGGNVLQRTRCAYYRDSKWLACNKRKPGSGCEAIDVPNRTHAVLGGSEACIATYPGDFAQALLVLDANVTLASVSGERTIPFADLHRLPGQTPHIETSLRRDELLTSFVIPSTPWAKRSLYLKIRDRQSYEFAVASAAVALDLDGQQVRNVRIAIGGMATIPWRARKAEDELTGKTIDEETAVHATEVAFDCALSRDGTDHRVALGKATLVRALLQAAALDVST